MEPQYKTVGVVGAGAMGRGIAQIATQAGSRVVLFDSQITATAQALKDIAGQWDKLVSKGRLQAEQADG